MTDAISNTQAELAQIFAGLSDEFLCDQTRSGDLTEAAQMLAEAELRRRGIDVPAVDRQPASETEDGGEAVEFVTVARFLVPTDAHILCGRLKADGIPAVVADANLVQANNLIAVAIGGVRVQVPVAFGPQATAIAAAVQRGDYALRDDVDPESGMS